MAIEFSPTNIFRFASFSAPFMLCFFLVMSSIFNQNLKGFVYLAGVMIASMINMLLMFIIGDKQTDEEALQLCNIFDTPYSSGSYKSPSMSAMFIAFTFAYLYLPMRYNNQHNYIVLVTLVALFVIDVLNKVDNKCTTHSGSLLGGMVGFMLGIFWYVLFHMSGYDSLLYFDDYVSNKTVCNRPRKQTFKCSVYKNGELIQKNIV